eukprot:1144961-Pelagomonas_calceolata.AAC.1
MISLLAATDARLLLLVWRQGWIRKSLQERAAATAADVARACGSRGDAARKRQRRQGRGWRQRRLAGPAPS